MLGDFECEEDQFACETGRCIPNTFLCDGEYDCGPGDFSDEVNDNCEGERERIKISFSPYSYFLQSMSSRYFRHHYIVICILLVY